MTRKAHWESIYRTKRPDEVSWFQPSSTTSLGLIRRTAANSSAAILDVGGGASRLIDGLLDAGYRHVTVLDVSAAALDASRRRLGDASSLVTWLEADVLAADLPAGAFDVWHDRALFHFFANQGEREQYVAQVRRALRPQGVAIVAAFADNGPARCSGLEVTRYTGQALRSAFGPDFTLVDELREGHMTPSGAVQAFVYAVLERR
jgi:SAM-dependent methyltransferase